MKPCSAPDHSWGIFRPSGWFSSHWTCWRMMWSQCLAPQMICPVTLERLAAQTTRRGFLQAQSSPGAGTGSPQPAQGGSFFIACTSGSVFGGKRKRSVRSFCTTIRITCRASDLDGSRVSCRRIYRATCKLGSFPFLSAGWAVAEEFSSAGLVAQWWEDFVEYPGVCFWVVFLVWV
jgi:hypothetical protein